MKTIRYTIGLCSLAVALSTAPGFAAQDAHKKSSDKSAEASSAKAGTLAKVSEKDAAWAAKAR